MATTAVAVNLEEVQRKLLLQIEKLESEATDLEAKLKTEQGKLTELQAKRPELARRIAEGKEKPAEVSSLTQQLAETEMRIEGFAALAKEKRAAVDPLVVELRQVQAKCAYETDLARFEAMKSADLKLAEVFAAQIEALLTAQHSYHEAREKLRREFPDGAFGPAAQALLDEMRQKIYDGAELRAVRALLRQDWQRTNDGLELPHLRPPKR